MMIDDACLSFPCVHSTQSALGDTIQFNPMQVDVDYTCVSVFRGTRVIIKSEAM